MIRWPLVRWRIGAIFVIGVLAILSVPVALFYAMRDVDEVAGLPQPRQLAAIVTLVEDTAPSERRAVFDALQSSQLSVRVADEAPVATDLDPLWPQDRDHAAEYRAALDGRAFAAYAVPRKLFSGGLASPLTAAELRVALRNGGVLIVTSESFALFTDSGVPLGFPTAFVGMLIAFVTLLLLNREFRPVLRLAKAVETLDPSDPDAQLPRIRAGTGEVRTLIEAFNQQQARVATLLRARSALIGGIQHDVRTFATRLRLRIEKLSDPDDRKRAETDIADLVALMDGALLATRGEVGKLELELIDFADLLRAEVRDQKAAGAAVELVVRPGAETAQILGDRVALRRILLNPIENALHFGSVAHLELRADSEAVTLTVDDDGPGIPHDRRSELMQPFSRLDPSRSRQTGGAGLGLAIVRTLVTGHDGQVSIEDAPMGGARIRLRLPKFSPHRIG
ncbi:MAG: ATP-binding protein [Pseudomonadota bacterium]